MDKQSALDRLRALEPQLRERGVLSLFLFGSVARDEAKTDSDVDLFFDDDAKTPLSLFGVIGLGHFLSDALGAKVDLIPRDSLHRLLRDEIVDGALRVY